LVESPEHALLKRIALLWLLNQGCFLADLEVPINRIGLERFGSMDTRTVIDALGIGLRRGNFQDSDVVEGIDRETLNCAEVYECITRGVEVKVTRGDFRAGFACSGCNYHYLLTPLKLLSPSEVPAGVGLIEYNKYKFSAKPDNSDPYRPFRIEGLRVLRRPLFHRVPRFQVDGAVAHLGWRRKESTIEGLLNGLALITGARGNSPLSPPEEDYSHAQDDHCLGADQDRQRVIRDARRIDDGECSSEARRLNDMLPDVNARDGEVDPLGLSR